MKTLEVAHTDSQQILHNLFINSKQWWLKW